MTTNIRLHRWSRLVQWAYLWEDGVPYQTSICPLFWRTVLLTPLKVGVPLGVLLLLVFWAVYYTRNMLFAVVIIIGVVCGVGVITGVSELLSRAHRRLGSAWREQSVVYQGFRSIKARMCPLVEIYRDDYNVVATDWMNEEGDNE